jgi:crotonobetainyl-CoA:carnitine CoA-transferase CaiB-like acyl-CoA transferase
MTALPLEGIRIVDLTVIWAGPYATMLLADWGAEVIRVENRRHFPLFTRGYVINPSKEFIKDRVGFASNKKSGHKPETAHNTFALFNAHARNKLSMTSDLRTPEGLDIFKRLIKVSDIFVESNSPRVKESLGITWEELKKINPKLIMLSMSGFGDTGPYKYYRALGAHQEGFGGHSYLRGYIDEEQDTTSTVYHTDEAAGISGALAVMMALYKRRKTGQGQYIDMAQVESSMPHLAQGIMDYTMNRRITQRMGNRDYHGAVQGCYRCKDVNGKWIPGVGGEPPQEIVDNWVNITVNASDWPGFCRALGNPVWTNDPKFADQSTRLNYHDELDKNIDQWTRQHDKYEVMHILQQEGVPAGIVMDEHDAYNNPHLKERGFFEELTHADCGTHLYPGLPFKMSNTPNRLRRPPVRLGEHNEYVYKEIIGVSDEEYQVLIDKGHIGETYIEK